MDLIYKSEKPLFIICLVISIIFWLLMVLGTVGIALFWVLFFFVIYLFVQSGLIAYLKGTAVKIAPDQFPDLYAQFQECCQKLSITDIPEIYMLHADGAFNAFATRFLKQHYIVLFSDVVDALEARKSALNFYMGHELGHIHRNHIFWGPILFPAGLLPLIGAAYSRAREYTCDNYGFACCSDPQDALFAIAALSAGGKRWQSMAMGRYVDQAKETGGFWMSFHELIADYPWLVKRLSRIFSLANKTEPQFPKRSLWAWLLALFVPRTGGSAGSGSVFLVITIIGIIAAIVLPNFAAYRNKALEASIQTELTGLRNAQEEYYLNTKRYAGSLEELGFSPSAPNITLEILSADEKCFEAAATTPNLDHPLYVDCNGLD
ncbi:MAG: M48 family metallopeptidase [Proteobacteria bacterium]|nr:M48 family metallopeptidase [Pseudomonadota bacterium]